MVSQKWTHGRTNRWTDRQTDILTYRKHRPRGPMLWKQHKLSTNSSPMPWQFYKIILLALVTSSMPGSGNASLMLFSASHALISLICFQSFFVKATPLEKSSKHSSWVRTFSNWRHLKSPCSNPNTTTPVIIWNLPFLFSWLKVLFDKKKKKYQKKYTLSTSFI